MEVPGPEHRTENSEGGRETGEAGECRRPQAGLLTSVAASGGGGGG